MEVDSDLVVGRATQVSLIVSVRMIDVLRMLYTKIHMQESKRDS
jgi:hypothetical protein